VLFSDEWGVAARRVAAHHKLEGRDAARHREQDGVKSYYKMPAA
jgi:hypothetical protein